MYISFGKLANPSSVLNRTEGSEKPSPRAIVERIAKLRKIVDTGGSNDDLPPTPSKTPPQKRKAAGSTLSAGQQGSGSSSKRARTSARKDKLGDMDTDDSEPDLSEPSTPRGVRTRKGNGGRSGSTAAAGMNGAGSRSSVYVDSDAETTHESDTSEFQLVVKEEPVSKEVNLREPSVVLA